MTELMNYSECGKPQRELILQTLSNLKGARTTSMGLKKLLPFPIKESALKRVLNDMEAAGFIETIGPKFNSNGRAYQVIKSGYE